MGLKFSKPSFRLFTSSLRGRVAFYLPLSLLLALSSVGLAPARGGASRNPLGESLYRSHCHRCHGDDGDATDYYNVVPLAGIGRRPPVGLVGQFRGESFSARGVEFAGERARALGRYLIGLRGRKGFPDPGWLWSPYLLDRKSALLNECRILDVRNPQEYFSAHIPNAVSVPLGFGQRARSLSRYQIEQLFQKLGIHEHTQVVIYDRSGGPEAAWFWWNLIDAGHPFVTLLDGGWTNWVAQGFPVSDKVPNIKGSDYRPRAKRRDAGSEAAGSPVRKIEWDWKETAGPEGLENAETLRLWLRRSGLEAPGRYRLESTPEEAAHLVFLLKLFGRSGRIQQQENEHSILQIDSGDEDP